MISRESAENRTWPCFRNNTSGATMVEAAVVLPIFIIFILVILDFSRAMALRNAVSDGLKSAARSAAVPSLSTSSGSSSSVIANPTAAERRDVADTRFHEYLERFGYGDVVGDFAQSLVIERSVIDDSGSTPVTIATTRGLLLRVQVPIPCITCPLVMLNEFDVNEAVFVPCEDQSCQCSNLNCTASSASSSSSSSTITSTIPSSSSSLGSTITSTIPSSSSSPGWTITSTIPSSSSCPLSETCGPCGGCQS